MYPMRLIKHLLSVFIAVSCGQDYNSHSADGTLGTGATTAECSTSRQARLCRARTILAEYCYSCHSGWAAYDSDTDWSESRLINLGDSKSSRIIRYLKNTGGNMPLGSGAIPEVEYQSLLEWIDKLGVD